MKQCIVWNSIKSSPRNWGGGTCEGRDEKGHPRSFSGNVTFLFYILGGEYAGARGIVLFSHTYFANVLLCLLNI